MNDYVIYVGDTETTGLSAEDNDVIEISLCRFTLDSSEIEREQKTWYLKALNPATISDEALKVNGHKKEDILHQTKEGREKYLEPKKVLAEIELWMMDDNRSALDRVFIGQNPKFDNEALKALWKRVNREESFPFECERGNRILDTKQIATLFDLIVGRRRRFNNLSSLVKAFGIKKGKAHQASEDVRMTTDLLLKMIEPLKPVIRAAFSDCYPDELDTDG